MSKTTKRLAVGTAMAGVLGYVAGVLTAPKSGKETRKDIKDKAVEVTGEAEKKIKSLHHELGEHATSLKKYVAKQTGKAKDAGDILQKEIETARERARGAISALRAGDEDEIDDVIADLERLKKVVQKRLEAAGKEAKK